MKTEEKLFWVSRSRTEAFEVLVAATSQEEAEEMALGLDELLDAEEDYVDAQPAAARIAGEDLVYDGDGCSMTVDEWRAFQDRAPTTFVIDEAIETKLVEQCDRLAAMLAGIDPNSLDFDEHDKAIVSRLAATFAELSAKN